MTISKIILGLALSITLFGCGQSAEEKAASEERAYTQRAADETAANEMAAAEAADANDAGSLSSQLAGSTNASMAANASSKTTKQEANNFISSSAALENNKDTTRRFIRTADLKFKVKSVIKSTLTIEKIAIKQDGFVAYTNLESVIDNVTSTLVSADSSLETTYYTVKNNLTIRVPNTKLDTTLKEIAKNIDYLDYRIIQAEDVSLLILKKKLAQKRLAINAERMKNAIGKAGKKLNDITEAEDAILNRQEEADNEKIANLSLLDKINFSTITLTIYQRQSIKRELIANDKNIDEYEPSFYSKIKESLKTGWEIVETFFVFITKFWGLVLIALIVIYFLKKSDNKKE